jgi:hypothetical protein
MKNTNTNTCTIPKTLSVFILLLICISNTLAKQDNYNNFWDTKGIYKYRKLPGVEQHRFRVNEYHELSCLTEIGYGLGQCAIFKKDDKTIPKAGTGKYNLSSLDYMCGINMYRSGFTSYGYSHGGQPCNKAWPQIYDKWQCKDFHDMDIAIFLTWDKVNTTIQNASNKYLYCASFDNETCATFKKQADCKAVGSQFGLYKLPMGHQGSFRRTEADTLSGKMFVLHHNVPVNRWYPKATWTNAIKDLKVGKKTIRAVSRWRSRNLFGMFYDYQNFIEFEIPNNLNYMRFKIVSQPAATKHNNFTKMQIALVLDEERILGQQDRSLAYRQMDYKIEFTGIAKDIKKGKHKLSFRVAQDRYFYFEAGEIEIDILGYY